MKTPCRCRFCARADSLFDEETVHAKASLEAPNQREENLLLSQSASANPEPKRCNRCHRAMKGSTAYDGACGCGGLIEAVPAED
jgi:hypothetical protein